MGQETKTDLTKYVFLGGWYWQIIYSPIWPALHQDQGFEI